MDDLLGVGRPRARPAWSSVSVGARPPATHTSDDDTFRRQRRAELGARRDAELREHAVQVRADRAMREKQSLTDLPIGQSQRRKLGDLQLLRGQLIAGLGRAAPAALPRRAQLAPRPLTPWRAPERIEGVARSPQDGA